MVKHNIQTTQSNVSKVMWSLMLYNSTWFTYNLSAALHMANIKNSLIDELFIT